MPTYDIRGYYNHSDRNVLNKNISDPPIFVVNGNIKQPTDLIRPTVIISSQGNNDWDRCNYLYIRNFHRYYFVKSKVWDTYGNITIECEVDPLMSHKDEIKQLSVIAKRSSNTYNMYQFDPEIPQYENRVVATQKFPYGFGSGEQIILAVNGGGAVI